MDERQTRLVAIVGVVASLLVLNLMWTYMGSADMEAILSDVDVSDELREHSAEFSQPEVIKVTEGVHVAIGYALANSIMLEAPDGLIIVDVTESYDAAKRVFAAFREISKKPVKGIVYTHNHADHIYGGKAFVEEENATDIEIWAHHTTMKQLHQDLTTIQMTYIKRAMRQFGALLPNQVNSGIGFSLRFKQDSTLEIVNPNRFLHEERMDINIAGLDLTLIHIPGETNDQIGVWIADRKIFLSADDIYKAFPNLYAIRGTHTRDVMQWVNSLDKMRELQPEFLVPSHTRPVEGAEKIYKLLTEYRDAIQLVHDQTVRWMNKGLFPDDIIEKVKLPAQLKENPYLKEFYGTTTWSSRAVFNSYMGWFSGHPKDLNPMNPTDKARQMALLAGGVKKLKKAARDALDVDNAQWCLELTSHILQLEPRNMEMKRLQAFALKRLSSLETSANGRNYYLTYAFELHKLVVTKPSMKLRRNVIMTLPMIQIFNAMRNRLRAEDAEGTDTIALFHFTDTNEYFSVHVRHCIAEVAQGKKDKWNFMVTTTSQVWRELVTKDRSPIAAYSTGAIQVEGGAIAFKTFMQLFDQDD